MWRMIGKLRGNDEQKNTRKSLYDKVGNSVEMNAEAEQMMHCWRGIYQNVENRVRYVWNDTRSRLYEHEREEGVQTLTREEMSNPLD